MKKQVINIKDMHVTAINQDGFECKVHVKRGAIGLAVYREYAIVDRKTGDEIDFDFKLYFRYLCNKTNKTIDVEPSKGFGTYSYIIDSIEETTCFIHELKGYGELDTVVIESHVDYESYARKLEGIYHLPEKKKEVEELGMTAFLHYNTYKDGPSLYYQLYCSYKDAIIAAGAYELLKPLEKQFEEYCAETRLTSKESLFSRVSCPWLYPSKKKSENAATECYERHKTLSDKLEEALLELGKVKELGEYDRIFAEGIKDKIAKILNAYGGN